MTVAAIDIGTNSMRLLIVSDRGDELHREVVVTGLGTGVDATGRFEPSRVAETLAVMEAFRSKVDAFGSGTLGAVATSATRDAVNGHDFVGAVASRIGVTPAIVTGEREAELSFRGAMMNLAQQPTLVIDVGGGSTEFMQGITRPEMSVSIDIGSVRITDRCLPDHPTTAGQIRVARALAEELFAPVPKADGARVVGVAGTFTSLSAIASGHPTYDRTVIDGSSLTLHQIDGLVERLSVMTLAELEAIGPLDPRRAPVIVGGAIVAAGALRAVGAEVVTVSESDLLDGLVLELLTNNSR
ncbi:MAG: exopolyphosphatase [Acidimicrobiia bacterium]